MGPPVAGDHSRDYIHLRGNERRGCPRGARRVGKSRLGYITRLLEEGKEGDEQKDQQWRMYEQELRNSEGHLLDKEKEEEVEERVRQ